MKALGPLAVALSVRQENIFGTGRLGVECSVAVPADHFLADWKGEACVAPRATGRTGRHDP